MLVSSFSIHVLLAALWSKIKYVGSIVVKCLKVSAQCETARKSERCMMGPARKSTYDGRTDGRISGAAVTCARKSRLQTRCDLSVQLNSNASSPETQHCMDTRREYQSHYRPRQTVRESVGQDSNVYDITWMATRVVDWWISDALSWPRLIRP